MYESSTKLSILKAIRNLISSIDPRLLENNKYSFKLTHNHLTAIPLQSFIEKDRLKILNCSYNKIKEIPRQVKALKNLNELNLTHNLIEIIPQELAELVKIQYPCLHLSKNPIKTIECIDFVLQKSHYYTTYAVDEFMRIGKLTVSEEQEEFYIDYDNYENDNIETKQNNIKDRYLCGMIYIDIIKSKGSIDMIIKFSRRGNDIDFQDRLFNLQNRLFKLSAGKILLLLYSILFENDEIQIRQFQS